MASKKVNPLLAAYYTQFEAEHRVKREMLNQLTLASCFMAAHEVFGCGPGRALRFLEAYSRYKRDIADALLNDIGDSHRKGGNGDREFTHTRHDLALALQAIFGQDGWMQGREFFGLLHDYWMWEGRVKQNE